MRTRPVVSWAIVLIVVAGALPVLCGCTAKMAESVGESEAEPMEGGQTMPDLEPEGPDPGLAPPEPTPDAGVSGPARGVVAPPAAQADATPITGMRPPGISM